MVNGKGPMGYAHLYPTRRGQLVGMYLGLHSPLGTSLQDAGRFFGCEETGIAEHIDILCQPLSAHLRYHLVDNEVNILWLGVLSAHCMSTKESGYDAYGQSFFHPPDHTKHLQFVVGVKTVTALDFNTSRALEHHLAGSCHRLLIELVLRHRVQQVGRIEDATATAGNLGIAHATNLIDKLCLAASRIYDVGVGVAPRGQHHASCGIHLHIYMLTTRCPVGHQSERGDAAVFHQQPGIVHLSQT